MKKELSSRALKDFVEKFLDDKKTQDIVSIELCGKSSLADHLIIASGTSARHISSVAQALREDLKKKGVKSVHLEGVPQCDWVLLDVGDVIVHLFRPEIRTLYNLEKIWGSADARALAS